MSDSQESFNTGYSKKSSFVIIIACGDYKDGKYYWLYEVLCSHRKRVVAGDEEDVEHGGGGQVAGQQTARVGEDGLGVDQREHEEGESPDTVEYLK